MKPRLYLSYVFAALVLCACNDKIDDPDMDKSDVEEKEQIELVLNHIVHLHYENGSRNDNYHLALATSEVVFDENAAVWRTVEDGYVLLMTLKTSRAADPAFPELPAGTYGLQTGDEAGIWDADGQNELICYEASKGISVSVPVSGQLTVTSLDGSYGLKGTFTSGVSYSFIYEGDLKFPGIDDGSELLSPIETEFIGGQALFFGSDELHPEYDYIRLELWDAEPDPDNGQVPGVFLKCKLYLDRLNSAFRGVPAGEYVVKSDDVLGFTAEAGHDDGFNIPTGTYVTCRADGKFRMSMIASGTITVADDGQLAIDLSTDKGVSVKGSLSVPLELMDLSDRQEIDDTPYFAASTLTGDVAADLSGVTEAYFVEYGDKFGNGGRNIVLQLIDEVKLEALVLDLNMPGAEKGNPLSEGTYSVDDGANLAYTFAPGMMMMGNTIGSYYCNLELHTSDGQTYYMAGDRYGPAASGTVQVEYHGDERYTLTVDWYDNALSPHAITSVWNGVLKSYSYDWN